MIHDNTVSDLHLSLMIYSNNSITINYSIFNC